MIQNRIKPYLRLSVRSDLFVKFKAWIKHYKVIRWYAWPTFWPQ